MKNIFLFLPLKKTMDIDLTPLRKIISYIKNTITIITCLIFIGWLTLFCIHYDIHFPLVDKIFPEVDIINTFFVGAGAFLTLMAFWIQYRANQIQIDINKEQSRSYSIEKFENTFYHFITYFRENTENMSIGNGIKGSRSFHFMFYEFYTIKRTGDLNKARRSQSGKQSSD